MTCRYPPLSLDRIATLFDVDLERGLVFWKNVSIHHKRLNGREAGSSRFNGKNYWVIKVDKMAYRRAQIILAVSTGRWPDQCVDHINGDSLDDRAANLRHASVAQNALNHKTRRKSADTAMGVRKTSNGRYQARIAFMKKQIALGVFDTEHQASLAYQAARKELFREFA